MIDTVYFNAKVAPADKDWLHCSVQRKTPEGIEVDVQSGYSTQRLFFPMHVVQRIEYGRDRR
jgi:hypothetical protein